MIRSNNLLDDLYPHQAWADAEHWNALEKWSGALEDAEIRARLHHIHLTQRAFLSIVRGEPVTIRSLGEFSDMAALKEYARQFHEEAAAFLRASAGSLLEGRVVIPWFKDPPIKITIAEALAQAAMHSQYHRGQNASRLRALGGEPPLTDLIVWYWKERPAAVWP